MGGLKIPEVDRKGRNIQLPGEINDFEKDKAIVGF